MEYKRGPSMWAANYAWTLSFGFSWARPEIIEAAKRNPVAGVPYVTSKTSPICC